MSKILNLNGEQDFSKEVNDSELPVLVDFWAPWCMPCKMMAPILDELSESMNKKIKIVKINIENPENMNLALKFNIQSIPNMKLFKNGNIVEEFIGLRDIGVIKKEIESLID
jgi:thioredoxin 1